MATYGHIMHRLTGCLCLVVAASIPTFPPWWRDIGWRERTLIEWKTRRTRWRSAVTLIIMFSNWWQRKKCGEHEEYIYTNVFISVTSGANMFLPQEIITPEIYTSGHVFLPCNTSLPRAALASRLFSNAVDVVVLFSYQIMLHLSTTSLVGPIRKPCPLDTVWERSAGQTSIPPPNTNPPTRRLRSLPLFLNRRGDIYLFIWTSLIMCQL